MVFWSFYFLIVLFFISETFFRCSVNFYLAEAIESKTMYYNIFDI